MENKKIVNCILQEFQSYQQVKAIAIGGSISAKTNDSKSDIDVYIFVDKDIPVIERESFVKKYSSKYEVGGEYFGSGDEFFVDKINQQLDVMYWNTIWFEGIIDKL